MVCSRSRGDNSTMETCRKPTFIQLKGMMSCDANKSMNVNFDLRTPKKEIARTKLVDSLYSRGPIIARSQTFVLPAGGYFGLGIGSGTPKPVKPQSVRLRRGSSKPATGLTTRSAPLLSFTSKPKPDKTMKTLQKSKPSDLSNGSYSKETLAIDSSSDSSSDDGRFDVIPNDIYRYIMNKGKTVRHNDANNPIKMKYRPITPSLMRSFDDMKISSRSATELWINELPNEKRSYHGKYYKIGKAGATELHEPNSKQTKTKEHTFIYRT